MNKGILISGLIILLGAILIWTFLDGERSSRIGSILDVEAKSLHLKVEKDVISRIETLNRIAQRWVMHEGTPQNHFEGDLKNIVQDLPGFQAIEWVDNLGYVRWVVPLEGNERAVDFYLAGEPKRKQALENAKNRNGPTITAPIELVQGGAGFLVYFPLFIGEKFDGFVLAVMRFDAWLEHVLSLDDEEIEVDFIVNRQSLFSSGNGSNSDFPAASYSGNILDWETEIRITPSANFIRYHSNYFPEYITAIYLFFSTLLLFGAHLIIRLTKTQKALRMSEHKTSQLVQSLQEFKNIVDEVKDCVFIFDAQTLLFTYVNQGAEKQIGYSAEELLSMHPYDFKPGIDELTFKQMIKPLFDGELSYLNFEAVHQHKDGHHIDVDINLQLEEEREGSRRFIAIVRDITEQKRKQSQLRQSQKLEAIGRLAGGIAHDFNNQLNVILGSAEIIPHSTDPKKIHLFANKIIKAANVSAKLTKQLLTFSRNDDVQFKAVDVHQLIQELKDISSRTFEKKITIETKFNATRSIVYADSSLLYNALFNLIINAKDAMPSGGTITICTDNRGDKDNAIEIKVIDTGVGIPPENQSVVFEPFFTTKPMGQGTGLGLASVKGAVEQNNGTIELDSQLGKGTTFSVVLPLSNDDVFSAAEHAWPEDRSKSEKQKKILVVDDEPLVNDVFCEYLDALGFDTFSAKNGQEAIELIEDKMDEIELVITDMLMPGIDGLELLVRIKSIAKSIKVIVVSGYMADNKKTEVIDAGAQTVLQKPVNFNEIKTELEKIYGPDFYQSK